MLPPCRYLFLLLLKGYLRTYLPTYLLAYLLTMALHTMALPTNYLLTYCQPTYPLPTNYLRTFLLTYFLPTYCCISVASAVAALICWLVVPETLGKVRSK